MWFIKFVLYDFAVALTLGATAYAFLYCRQLQQEKKRQACLRRFVEHIESYDI